MRAKLWEAAMHVGGRHAGDSNPNSIPKRIVADFPNEPSSQRVCYNVPRDICQVLFLSNRVIMKSVLPHSSVTSGGTIDQTRRS